MGRKKATDITDADKRCAVSVTGKHDPQGSTNNRITMCKEASVIMTIAPSSGKNFAETYKERYDNTSNIRVNVERRGLSRQWYVNIGMFIGWDEPGTYHGWLTIYDGLADGSDRKQAATEAMSRIIKETLRVEE